MTPGLVEAETVYVTNENTGLADAIAVVLAEHGFTAKAVAVLPEDACVVILTSGLAGDAPPDAHWNALAHAKGLAPGFASDGGTLIVLQDTGGAFRPMADDAWSGGLTGLAKTAACEWPEACVRAIDIACETISETDIATRLVQELVHGSDAIEIGLPVDGRRLAPKLVDVETDGSMSAGTSTAKVWLVTGGGRGVTASCTIALAARQGGCFVLMGRSALIDWPNDIQPTTDANVLRGALAKASVAAGAKPVPAEISKTASTLLASQGVRETLSAVKAAGGEARYLIGDITDADSVLETISEAETAFGQIDGLIHGAGVLADKSIADKTREQFDRVFQTKIKGLQLVLDALGERELKSIALFSSVAARFGNAGQVDYAMANEVLNRVAWSLKATRPGARVLSLNWGPWDGGMVTPSLRAHFKSVGISLIPIDAGSELFADLMVGADIGLELCIGSGLLGAEDGPGAEGETAHAA